MNLNAYAIHCHSANMKWWIDPETERPIERNYGELIALCHSELSEALEGRRKNLQDDHLPHRKAEEVEVVDCLIRLFDLAAAFGYDLDGAYMDKMAYNEERADHTYAARLASNGKRF